MTFRTALCALAALILLPLAPCTAADNTVASADATLAETACAGLGPAGFVAVWSADQGNYDFDIQARRFDTTGRPLGAAVRVNTYTESSQAAPSVAALSGGGYVVVWTSNGQDGSMGGIWGRRYGADGSPAGAEFPVNSNTFFNQYKAKVAGLAGGGFVVVWESPMEDWGNRWTDEIFARVFDASGSAVTGELQVNSYTVGLNTIFGPSDSQMNPALAALPDGGFVVVWESYREYDGYSVNKGISGRCFDAAGSPLEPAEFSVNTTTTGNQEGPAVAARQDGGFLVAWYGPEPSGSGYLDVYAQGFLADGAKSGAEFRVNSFTTGNQSTPSVLLLATGDNLVAWQSYQQDGESGGIYGQKLAVAGIPVGAEFRINAGGAGDQSDQSLAALGGESWVAVWRTTVGYGSAYSISSAIFPVPPKAGDCDQDGAVSIAEIQSAINMYLGLKDAAACVDQNGMDGVTIADVQKTINAYFDL